VGRHRVRICAQPYEGNAWERMFIRGLRSGNEPPAILGFQHSVVPPAAAGVFVGGDELALVPLPDKVLTTGEKPAAILRRQSAVPAERIGKSGALRYEYLHRLEAAPRRRGNSRVLVALEGVGPVLSMLEYALDQAACLPEIRFRIRAHPVLPLATLLFRLGLDPERLPPNIEIAKAGPVRDDVLESDAVLYWGTTVAVEAVFMGRPVIHYSAGELLSYDPLFELRDFKWTTGRGRSLGDIMSAIRALGDELYVAQQMRAREYVSAYFEPVDEGGLRSILQPVPGCAAA
jgi:surface carbohydrate biosynthesis protein (TIGR04326 family)